MIKDKYLEPFYKKNINLDIYIEKNIKVEDIINFLKKMDEEDIKKIGNSIAFLYPKEIMYQFTDDKYAVKTFANVFRADYKLKDDYNLTVKHIGLALIKNLQKNNNLTPKEFIKKNNL